MYVYVTDKWNIILKSEKRLTKMWGKYREFRTEYKNTDNLIYEGGKIIRYEDSKQYIEDSNRYKLDKQINELTRKNKDLEKIANSKVRKELELDVKWEQANEYQRKVYMIRNMRWLNQKECGTTEN